MSSILFPLLAAAAALIPSAQPALDAPSPAQASAAASVTIVGAVRLDWSRAMVRPGPRGEIRQDLDFQ